MIINQEEIAIPFDLRGSCSFVFSFALCTNRGSALGLGHGQVNTSSKHHGISWFTKQAQTHDDVIKWKHFPRYWPFVRGIYLSPVNSPHKGQWRGALMFTLIYARINGWVNNRAAGDLRRHRAHYDVIVMFKVITVNNRGAWCNMI